jgi:carbon storage regulator
MLVLSRKPGERILIGDDIAVTVVRIGPNTVRLGIDAPRHLNIIRDELSHPEEGIQTQSPEKIAARQ